MKYLGKLHYCLGISIEQDEETHSINNIYSWNTRSMECLKQKLLQPPADLSVKLKKDDGVSKPVDPRLYQSMVGSLLYAAVSTRPDIAQAVGAVAKFSVCPTEAHMTAVKRIFRYLKGTSNLALRFGEEGSKLMGYSDADWAGDLDD